MRVLGERARMKFSELFAGAASRSEIVATFLALLELIRLKQVAAIQDRALRGDRYLPAWIKTPAAAKLPHAGYRNRRTAWN